MLSCQQVMKSLLDRVEREERQNLKRKRKEETQADKKQRLASTKMVGLLYKHKEALKREILAKRELLEQNMLKEAQVLRSLKVFPKHLSF